MGTGRKEFDPRKPRPGLEHYIQEAGRGVLAQIPDPALVDECVISNFMAARFNRQGNLAALMPTIHPSLEYKPSTRVEGACGSGGLGVLTGMKSVLADLADVVLVLGVEVQNTVKAIYGADILAGAGHYASQRKDGHAYFFPAFFSDRAGAAFQKYGQPKVRAAMTQWFVNAIEAARKLPGGAGASQHRRRTCTRSGTRRPRRTSFVREPERLRLLEGLRRRGGAAGALRGRAEEGGDRRSSDAVEIVGWGTAVADITQAARGPDDARDEPRGGRRRRTRWPGSVRRISASPRCTTASRSPGS